MKLTVWLIESAFSFIVDVVLADEVAGPSPKCQTGAPSNVVHSGMSSIGHSQHTPPPVQLLQNTCAYILSLQDKVHVQRTA